MSQLQNSKRPYLKLWFFLYYHTAFLSFGTVFKNCLVGFEGNLRKIAVWWILIFKKALHFLFSYHNQSHKHKHINTQIHVHATNKLFFNISEMIIVKCGEKSMSQKKQIFSTLFTLHLPLRLLLAVTNFS